MPNQLCPGCHLRTASQTRPGSPQPTAVTVFLRVPYYGIWPVPQQTQIHLSCTWGSNGRERYVPRESQNTEFTKYLTSGYKKKNVSETVTTLSVPVLTLLRYAEASSPFPL